MFTQILCRAILTALVNQMKIDDRIGSSFKSCDQVINGPEEERHVEVNEVSYHEGANEMAEAVTWSRKDSGSHLATRDNCGARALTVSLGI